MVHLYSLTLQKASAVVKAVHGNFCSAKTQDIAVAKGKLLELYRPDSKGKLRCLSSTEVFGLIRDICLFRLTSAPRDFLVVGSDSGRIVILEFNTTTNQWTKAHQETYGKSGIRRIVPGQYVAADSRGRAIMIGAVERSKFIYVMNRDANARLTISSPLEAHKSHQICYALVGVDVGFENPVFASIEASHDKAEKIADTDEPPQPPSVPGGSDFALPPPAAPSKGLVLWEMDLGLNHVIKKCTMPIDSTAHALISVPALTSAHEGPSGVLVCCENFIVYKKPEHQDIVCAIPRRLEMGQDKGLMVGAHATHRLKDFCFFLLQSEFGDIYKVELIHSEGAVTEIVCRYLDTIPVAISLCVLKTGFLFAASEFGNHQMYQFTGVGTDETDSVCTSIHPHGQRAVVAFKPHNLRNLLLVDEVPSLAPIVDMKVIDALNEGTPQLYTLCGRGPRSTLRIMQHGGSVEELADNELPGSPKGVWTVKKRTDDEYDCHIVISFVDSTLVLAIGETVEEVSNSDFDTSIATLLVDSMADHSHIQVHAGGFRHIKAMGRSAEWRTPASGRRVVAASSNGRQVVLALNGGEVVCFELDESNILTEYSRRDLGHEVTCVSVQKIPPGRRMASFVAVGGLDSAVRILSLERDKGLRQHSMSAFANSAHPETVCLVQLRQAGSGDSNRPAVLCLTVGLDNGVFVRAQVDFNTGQLSDNRSRYLGAKPVSVNAVTVSAAGGHTANAVMALSLRPSLFCSIQGKLQTIPLHYDQLDAVSPFSSEQCPNGFVALANRSLRIFQLSKLTELFSQTVVPLTYTPRRLTPLPPPFDKHTVAQLSGGQQPTDVNMLAIVEADHNSYDDATKVEIRNALKNITLHDSDDATAKANEDEEDLPESQIGTFKAGKGKWGSCLRIVNPATASTLRRVDFELDEAALTCTVCRFIELDVPCLVLGTVHGLSLCPRRASLGSIRVYVYDTDYNLTLLHTTPVEDVVQAMCPWNGRLLVAVGKRIRIYSLGKRKLLKKCEFKNMPEAIVWMKVVGDRIFVADIRESVHLLKYREHDNTLQVISDDSAPLWVSAAETLDYHTVMIADKFDSITVARVPEAVRDDSDNTTTRLKGETAYLTGACPKFEHLCHFHMGETIMAMQKAQLSPGGAEVIVLGSIMGSISVMMPFKYKEELDFFQHLEMIMRTENPPLCGREHLAFRSYYFPVKNVIDGDLCEQYADLPLEKQREIASELDKTTHEVLKKLEDLGTKVL